MQQTILCKLCQFLGPLTQAPCVNNSFNYLHCFNVQKKCIHILMFLYPPHNEVVWVYIGFILSVCPFVCPAFRVCSVASTVLVGSISYLYILSNNIRRCVVCEVSCKISIFGNLFKFVTLLCLVLGWDLIWITITGNHGAAGVSQNTGVLVVLV